MIADQGDGPHPFRVLAITGAGVGAIWKWAPAWLPVLGYGAAGLAGVVALGVAGGLAYEAARDRRDRSRASNLRHRFQSVPESTVHEPRPEPAQPAKSEPPAPMTPMGRQQQVARFVAEFRAAKGREPSFTEVRNALDLPKSTASVYLERALKAKMN